MRRILVLCLLAASLSVAAPTHSALAATCDHSSSNFHNGLSRDAAGVTDTWYTGLRSNIEYRAPGAQCTPDGEASAWVMLEDGTGEQGAYVQIGWAYQAGCTCPGWFWQGDKDGDGGPANRESGTFGGTPVAGSVYRLRVLYDGANDDFKVETDFNDDGTWSTVHTFTWGAVSENWPAIILKASTEILYNPSDLPGSSSQPLDFQGSQLRNDNGAGWVSTHYVSQSDHWLWANDCGGGGCELFTLSDDHFQTFD